MLSRHVKILVVTVCVAGMDVLSYAWAVLQDNEPALASHLYSSILGHASLESSLAFTLANKLSSPTLLSTNLMQVILRAYSYNPVRSVLQSVCTRCLAAANVTLALPDVLPDRNTACSLPRNVHISRRVQFLVWSCKCSTSTDTPSL